MSLVKMPYSLDPPTKTPNLGKPESLIGAPSLNNFEHSLLYRI